MSPNNQGPRLTFRYLNEADMISAGVTDMARCIDAMEATFKLLAIGDYRLAGPTNSSHGAYVHFPPRSPFPNMPLNAADRRFMAMPGYLGGKYNKAGVKWYGSNADNKQHGLPRSILMFVLNDPVTGAITALMSANLLSAVRTGAVPGVGARYFARPDARVLGVIGPGVMNITSLRAFMIERPKIDTIRIKGRSNEAILSFIDKVRREYPSIQTIDVVDDDEGAVRGADIVSIAASTVEGSEHYPFVKREWLKPGAYLSLPANVRIDDELYGNDVLKVTDSLAQYEDLVVGMPSPYHEHNGIIGMYFVDLIESGKIKRDDVVDIGDVILGKKSGRRDSNQVVLFSVGGLPLEDIAWGSECYENAIRKNIGTELLLWDEPAMR